jgi:hypothetical protein
MTAIINRKTPIDSEYLQYNDKFLGKLEVDTCHNTLTHLNNRPHPTHRPPTLDKQTLEFILSHFEGIDFPRRISTKTTNGRQVLVNDKPEALARFKQANQLDCLY